MVIMRVQLPSGPPEQETVVQIHSYHCDRRQGRGWYVV